MATMAATPAAAILKKAADELAKNIIPTPELHYTEFYGTRDELGKHPSDDVMKHIASRHYTSHDIANMLKTLAKMAFFITIIIGLFKVPELGSIILALIRDVMIGG